jgi:hypothetical protein
VRASAWLGCADIRERKVRKMGRAMKQKRRRMSRGGRIEGNASPDMPMDVHNMVRRESRYRIST